jgi:hypothetical protein
MTCPTVPTENSKILTLYFVTEKFLALYFYYIFFNREIRTRLRRESLVSSKSVSDRANLIHLVPIASNTRKGCYRGKAESAVETLAEENSSFVKRTVSHVMETMKRAPRLNRYKELQL